MTDDSRSAKQQNAFKGRSEKLVPVPLASTGESPNLELPTIEMLLVAGNERLPSGGQNLWNAKRSLEIIKAYDDGYETDEEVTGVTSRKRRLALGSHLGITAAQFNIASTVIDNLY